ncbi:MAG TPA: hypothetical protein VMT52_04175 [Planctomycetota bacterium]|nr:hypothetical protein [Planctomycetota bacterium]
MTPAGGLSGRAWGLGRLAIAGSILLPFALLLVLSFRQDGMPGAGNYLEALDSRTLVLLGRTVLLAAGGTAIALVLGGAAAVAFERRVFPARSILRVTALAPLLIPPVFHVAVWERLAAPGGVLPLLLPFAVEAGRPFPIRNVAMAALILGSSCSPIPFFFLSSALRALPRELVEAARISRGPVAIWTRVILPLLFPSIAAGAGLVFTLTLWNHEVPGLLDVMTYPVVILVNHGVRNDAGLAFAAASPLLALGTAVLLASELWAERRGFALVGREKGECLAPEGKPGVASWLVAGGWWAFVALLPVAMLVRMAGPPSVYGAAWITDGPKVLLGCAVHGLSALLAVLAAGALLLPPRAGRPRRVAGLWLAFALPGSLLAFALAVLTLSGPLSPLYDSWGILVAASLARFVPIAACVLAAQLRSVPRGLWEAADLAPGALRRWFGIRLPLAAPGLAVGAVAVLLLSSGELSATLLLSPPGHGEPLMVRIYNLIHYRTEHDVLAALCLYHAASITLVAGMLLVGGRLLGRR